MFKVWFMRLAFEIAAVIMWRRKAPRNLAVANRKINVRGGEIAVRIYTPESAGPHPVVVYYHGGGFVLGSLGTVDGPCRDIAANSQHVVVSVDYRQAPEFPFPAAADDAIDAVQWVKDNAAALNVDASRIVVAGDSAGGNLAAVAALHYASAEPGLIKGQVLIYPVTHHYEYGTASYTEKATGHGLTRDMMVWFWDLYYRDSTALEPGSLAHPLSTPLTADDLSALPPALVMTAEHDPLRDEGIEYYEKLEKAGVPVQHTLYADAQHGFIGAMGPTEVHKRGIAEIAGWLGALD